MSARAPLAILVLLLAACGGERAPAAPAPGGGARREDLAELAGRWILDRRRYADDLLATTRERSEGTLAKMSAKEARSWEDLRAHLVRQDAEGTTLDLTLSADGTFSVRGVFGAIPEKTEGTLKEASGTFSRDGAEIVLTTTRENGRALREPERVRGTVEGRRLSIVPARGASVSLVFLREAR